MKKFLKTPGRIYSFAIGTIVDTFSFIQIIKQTQFKIPALFNSPWFWLFVIITLSLVSLFSYFKWQDYKSNIVAQMLAHKTEFTDYRKRVHEEFGRTYNEISRLNNEVNKLHWKLEEMKELSKADHSV